MTRALPERDLEEILAASEASFDALRGGHVLLTGATGFVGSWLCDSLLWAKRRAALDVRLTILVRNPEALPQRYAEAVAGGHLSLARGDVRTFSLDWKPDAIVNAATPTVGHTLDAAELVATIAQGAENVLRVAARSGAIAVLFTSSGAIYGRQPAQLQRIPETYAGAYDPLDLRFAYHEAKRFAETLHAAAGARHANVQPKIARLFAFAGPHLPLDAHFAIGNFIRDAMRGGPVAIGGDGSPYRSYLYGGDMTAWLWRILTHGQPLRAYNVGSEHAFSIEAIARTVCAEAGLPANAVTIAQDRAPGDAERYVPDTTRARTELGLAETVSLEASIARTLAWHRRTLDRL